MKQILSIISEILSLIKRIIKNILRQVLSLLSSLLGEKNGSAGNRRSNVKNVAPSCKRDGILSDEDRMKVIEDDLGNQSSRIVEIFDKIDEINTRLAQMENNHRDTLEQFQIEINSIEEQLNRLRERISSSAVESNMSNDFQKKHVNTSVNDNGMSKNLVYCEPATDGRSLVNISDKPFIGCMAIETDTGRFYWHQTPDNINNVIINKDYNMAACHILNNPPLVPTRIELVKAGYAEKDSQAREWIVRTKMEIKII